MVSTLTPATFVIAFELNSPKNKKKRNFFLFSKKEMSLLWSLSPAGVFAAKSDTIGVPEISFKVCPLSGNRTARIWCRVNPARAAERGLPENVSATALLRLNKALPPYTAYGIAYVGVNKNGPAEPPLSSELWEILDALFTRAPAEDDAEEDEEEDAAAAVEIKVERPRRAAGPPDRFVP